MPIKDLSIRFTLFFTGHSCLWEGHLSNLTCGATHCGDPVQIREQSKVCQ